MVYRSIILLGLRCSGKSTIGPMLAERMGVDFCDLDNEAAAVLNVATAGDAIRDLGLETFRDGEVQALWRVLSGDVARRGSVGPGRPARLVLALGGGTPTAPGAEPLLKSASSRDWLLVYLRASVPVLQQRMSRSKLSMRPSLTGRSPLDEIGILHGQRDGPYGRLAELSLEVDELSAGAATEWILSRAEQ